VGFDTRPLTTHIGNRFGGYFRDVLEGFRDLTSNIACIQNWVRGCFSHQFRNPGWKKDRIVISLSDN
jgi:hypothetical protein